MNWRRYVENIAPYVPGKSIEVVKKESNKEEIIRLASNENPIGPSTKVVEAIRKNMKNIHLYPDSSAIELRTKLASLYDVQEDEIITGNGADDVISTVISAFVNEGDEVLYCNPTFPAYRSSTILLGGEPVEVPLTKDFTYDLEELRKKITERTKLIFICNPNNPTGTIVNAFELEHFISNVPEHVIVVLDEAYIEYVRKEDYLTGIDFFKRGAKVITIRTFSKYYGLAGLRVGYAIASKELLKPMLRLRAPFAVNRLAISAAIAAIDDIEFTENHFKMNELQKNYLQKELQKLGFTVYPSSTNFLFVHVKRNGEELSEQLLQKGIIVRSCHSWGYDEHIRISIGTKEQNELLLKALRSL